MDFQRILPNLPPPPIIEALETQILTREFYQEVQHREDFKAYCQWYYETAQQHQREFAKMQNDLNILRWFLGKR